MGGFWGILKRKRYYGRRFTSKHELVQMIQQYRTYLPQYAERKASKSLKKQQTECPDTLRNQQVMCSSHTTSSMKKPEISVVSGFFILEAIADNLSRRQAGQQDKLKSCLAAAFQKGFG